jgi:hypothetical protein
MRKVGVSRNELFEQIDRPALKLLPTAPYQYAEWRKCRVAPVPTRQAFPLGSGRGIAQVACDADQCRNRTAPRNCLCRIAPMLQGIFISRWCAR